MTAMMSGVALATLTGNGAAPAGTPKQLTGNRAKPHRKTMPRAALALAASFMLGSTAHAAGVVSREIPLNTQVPPAAMFMNAKPMPLPRPAKLPVDLKKLKAGVPASAPAQRGEVIRQGNPGGPVQAPVQLVPYTPPAKGALSITPQAMGDGGIPFSTSRVELDPKRPSVVNMYPYRATGKLGITFQGKSGWCSAALIDKGLLLTAAHCVSVFGKGLLDAQWTFIPGYHQGKGAYGAFSARAVFAPKSYLDGSDTCDEGSPGVICANDVAVIVLRPDSKKRYPGELTGWMGVRVDGWGFEDLSEDGSVLTTHITQLGYPGGLDRGEQMIRNDASAGRTRGILGSNTYLGSPLDPGSSGGPWLNNFGISPDYGNMAIPAFVDANMIVGVTSWGANDGGRMAVQGASPLTSDNAGALIKAACAKYSAACTPQKP